MFCIKCGSQNSEGSSFCVRCGAPLWVAPERNTQPFPAAPQAKWTPEPIQTPPVETPAQAPHTPEVGNAFPLTDAAPAEERSAQPEQMATQTFTPVSEAQAQPVYQAPPAPDAMQPGSVVPPVVTNWQGQVPPQMPTEQQRKVRPAPSGGKKALTVILCIFFALFFLYASTIGLLRNLLDEDVYEDVLNKTDFNGITLTVDGEEYEFAEYIYEAMPSPLRNVFTLRNIEDILDSEEAKEAAAEALAGYTDYFVAGESMRGLTAEDICDFFEKNDDLSDAMRYSAFGYSQMYSALENSFEFDNIKSASKLERFLDANFGLVKFLLSPLGYGIAIFLCVLMLALILIINRANIPASLPAVFITWLVLGSLYLLLALSGFGVTLFVGDGVVGLLSALIARTASLYAMRGGILFVVGLAWVLIRKIWKKKQAKTA